MRERRRDAETSPTFEPPLRSLALPGTASLRAQLRCPTEAFSRNPVEAQRAFEHAHETGEVAVSDRVVPRNSSVRRP